MHSATLALPIDVHSTSFGMHGCPGQQGQRQGAIVLYAAGTQIYAPGDKARGHYRIEFGAVRIYRLLADGRRQISAFHLAGESFGLEPGGEHEFFAEAICATGVKSIRPLAPQDSALDLLHLALQGMMRAQQHLLVVGRQNAMERIGAFLLDMVERQGGLAQIELPMSRQDIGDYLGLTIETVSRSFSKQRERGIVKLHGLRCVEVCKPGVLEAICE